MIYMGFFSGKFLSQGFKFQITPVIADQNYLTFPVPLLKKLVFIFATISLIGILGRSVLIIQAIGGFEDFVINPSYTRSFIIEVNTREVEVNFFLLKFFSYMTTFTFPCVIAGGVLYSLPKNKLIGVYPLFIAIVEAVLNFQRGAFIRNYIVWLICAFFFIYHQPKLYQNKALLSLLRQLFYFLVIFLLFSLFILFLRFFFASSDNIAIIINSFYFYIAGNLWTLDSYLTTDPQPLYGLSLLRSFVSWFSAFGLAEKSSILPPHYSFYPIHDTAMNTFTYIRIFYEDFNLPGLVIISYLWGMMTYVSIKAYLKKFTFLRLAIAVLLTNTLLWSFYGFEMLAITLYIVRMSELALLDFFLKRLETLNKL